MGGLIFMEETTDMDSIKINGKSYDFKFNYAFQQTLLKDYSTDDVDGFSRAIEQLLNEDPDVLIHVMRAAIVGKDKPSLEDVATALEESEFFDNDSQFAKIYNEIRGNGFLAMKIAAFMKNAKESLDDAEKMLKTLQSDKQVDKDTIESLKLQIFALKTRYNRVANGEKKFSK